MGTDNTTNCSPPRKHKIKKIRNPPPPGPGNKNRCQGVNGRGRAPASDLVQVQGPPPCSLLGFHSSLVLGVPCGVRLSISAAAAWGFPIPHCALPAPDFTVRRRPGGFPLSAGRGGGRASGFAGVLELVRAMP